MLPGVRTLVPLALLSLVALLTIAADDNVGASPRVAATAMVPAAAAMPMTSSLLSSVDSLDAEPVGLPNDRGGTVPAASSAPTIEPTPTLAAASLVPVASVAPTPRPPAPTAQPVVAAPTARPAPTAAPTVAPAATCPSDWFCYPRLGLRGPIVPYTDCVGGSDIGTSIRAFTCLSPRYLMGHAYTTFGAITAWRAGDVVTAYGQTYTITGAVTARSCEPPLLPLAPLSMQTSLSPSGCGSVLIVQAR